MQMLSPERYAAWRAREDERINRWRTCCHRYDETHHAGVLGLRHHCSRCFHMYVPHEHMDCTACEFHPSEDE